MNCDRIAGTYKWFETAVFGGRLQKARIRLLPLAGQPEKVLVVGDGDGRFTAALLGAVPAARVVAVDNSAGMIREASKRTASGQVSFTTADALTHPFGSRRFDMAATHFFLDCFTDEELAALAPRISAAIRPGAAWLVSEFAIPESRWTRLPAKALIWFLYQAFGAATGLRVRRLPDYERALGAAGLSLEHEETDLGGLLVSQLWRKPSDSANNEPEPGR